MRLRDCLYVYQLDRRRSSFTRSPRWPLRHLTKVCGASRRRHCDGGVRFELVAPLGSKAGDVERSSADSLAAPARPPALTYSMASSISKASLLHNGTATRFFKNG